MSDEVFFNDYYKAVYRIATVDELIAHLKDMTEKYASIVAGSFMNSLSESAPKLCHAYTSQYFTSGHTSTQRAESQNSRIKGRGDLKKDLRKCDLDSLISHLEHGFKGQELITFNLLIKCVTKNQFMSDYVSSQWSEQVNLVPNYTVNHNVSSLHDSNFTMYSVQPKAGIVGENEFAVLSHVVTISPIRCIF